MADGCPECKRLRIECDELRALVAEQFEGLATLRREYDATLNALRKQNAEILDLVAKRNWLVDAIKQETAERLGVATPTRN
jgi:hypothetical protein